MGFVCGLVVLFLIFCLFSVSFGFVLFPFAPLHALALSLTGAQRTDSSFATKKFIFAKLSLLQQLYLDGKRHVNCILLEVYYHSTPLDCSNYVHLRHYEDNAFITLT